MRAGTNGTLEIGEEAIRFVTEKPADSRTWLYRDIETIGRPRFIPLPRDDEPGDIRCGAEVRASGSGIPSGVTSKPAIEGHFKTGQRTITLDEPVLPYRLARWQVQFEYQHGILQDLIPVFSFLGRELRFQN